MAYTNNLTSKGQVTVPKEFRDRLGLDEAGKVQFSTNSRGEVVISRPLTEAELRAVVARPGNRNSQMSDYDRKRGEELMRKYGIR